MERFELRVRETDDSSLRIEGIIPLPPSEGTLLGVLRIAVGSELRSEAPQHPCRELTVIPFTLGPIQ